MNLLRWLVVMLVVCGFADASETFKNSDFTRITSEHDIGVFAPGQQRNIELTFTVDQHVQRVIDITTTCTCSVADRDRDLRIQGRTASISLLVEAGNQSEEVAGGVVNVFLATDQGLICRSLCLRYRVAEALVWPGSAGAIVNCGELPTGPDLMCKLDLRRGPHPTTWNALTVVQEYGQDQLHVSLQAREQDWQLVVRPAQPLMVGRFSTGLIVTCLQDGESRLVFHKKVALSIRGAFASVPSTVLVGSIQSGQSWTSSIRLAGVDRESASAALKAVRVSSPSIVALIEGDRVLLRSGDGGTGQAYSGSLILDLVDGTSVFVPIIGRALPPK